MKILLLLDDFPPITYTGVSIVALGLAKGFVERGHEVFVITSVQDKNKIGEEEYEGIKIFRIYSQYHYRWRAYVSLNNPKVVGKVEEIIKKIKPDVCHFHHIHHHLSYRCFKIAKKYCQAVFLTAHDTMLFTYDKLVPRDGKCVYKVSFFDNIKQAKKRYNPLRNIFIRYYLKYIDQIFSVSDFLNKALQINGIKNVATIHNAVKVGNWQVDPEEILAFKNKYNIKNNKIILFGGRLSGAKGGEVILEAMVLVKKEVEDSILLIVGKKNFYAEKMLKLAKKIGISEQIKFTDWIDRDKIKVAFFSADVCVTPSAYCDAFNLFNIEAAVAKKPVVGSCFGGIPEIVVNEKTGYVVNPLHVDIFADKIIDLLKNPKKANEFGQAGYQRVLDNFSLDDQVEKTLTWYNKFVNINK